MFNLRLVRNDFDKAAPVYDQHAQLQQAVLRQLLSRLGPLPKEAFVLDAGCGTGQFATLTRHANILALDGAFSMCRSAAQHARHSVNADMSQLPLPDNSVDVVFSSLALQWAADWRATLAEWLRVLKPGGVMAFSSFAEGTLRELAGSFAVADGFAHVSPFVHADALRELFPLQVEEETRTEHYADLPALMGQLKALGARNKSEQRRRSLMTPRMLQRVAQHYHTKFGGPHGIAARWNIVYGIGKKP